MLLSLMINKFILPIKPIFTVPITTLMKTMKDTLTSEMFLEMAREITIATKGLSATLICTNKAMRS